MIRFATKIDVTDFYDQMGEGIRLNNETLTGVDSNDTENIVIKKVLIDKDLPITMKVSELVKDLKEVDTVSMACFVPQQFKDSYAIPVPIKVFWGTLYMGSMSTFTMYGVAEGLQNDLLFENPVFPDNVGQVLVVLFIDIKEG